MGRGYKHLNNIGHGFLLHIHRTCVWCIHQFWIPGFLFDQFKKNSLEHSDINKSLLYVKLQKKSLPNRRDSKWISDSGVLCICSRNPGQLSRWLFHSAKKLLVNKGGKSPKKLLTDRVESKKKVLDSRENNPSRSRCSAKNASF